MFSGLAMGCFWRWRVSSMRCTAPHFCLEWDQLFVCPWDPEAEACLCRYTFLGWLDCWFRFLRPRGREHQDCRKPGRIGILVK